MLTSPSTHGATVAKWTPSSFGTEHAIGLKEAVRESRTVQQSETSSPVQTAGSRSFFVAPSRQSSRSESPCSPMTVRLGSTSCVGSPLFQYSYSAKLAEPDGGSPWGRNEVGQWL